MKKRFAIEALILLGYGEVLYLLFFIQNQAPVLQRPRKGLTVRA